MIASERQVRAEAVEAPSGRSVPRHIAIIMDGNGRWANARGLPRVEGHRRGVEAVRRTVRAAGDLGIDYLTLFSFSTENWTRPPTEVTYLLGLLRRFLREDLNELHGNGVRVRVIGDRSGIDADIVDMIHEAEERTRANTRQNLQIAFNYGARQEITQAVRALAREVEAGRLAASAIDEAMLSARLYSADIPDPDLMIRTSGELRISNFLLWQLAYAELLFTPTLWPDFGRADLESALDEFSRRDRRFGGLAKVAP